MRSLEWALFLSSRPVLGHFVDAMVGTINEQIAQDSALRRTVSVRELSFINALRYDLQRWRGYRDDPGIAGLRNTGSTLHQGTLQRVLLPTVTRRKSRARYSYQSTRALIVSSPPMNPF
ncbi:hypothetical protein FIBSPDRAFT_559103 [Athelia psychrophila]|nr:hypothetical protein FIBSPDRAFT_559103 [Fibularhizoctonia sp. CBS 109695]